MYLMTSVHFTNGIRLTLVDFEVLADVDPHNEYHDVLVDALCESALLVETL